MKLFRAFAKDSKGQKYAGSFEAADENAARQMLTSEGYTEIFLEEIATERQDPKFRTRKKFADHAGEGGRTAKGASAGWARFVARYGPKTSGVFKVYFGGFTVLALICGISLCFYKPPAPLIPPEGTVAKFFNHEFSRNFALQYELFSGRLQAQYGARALYEKQRKGESPAEAGPTGAGSGAVDGGGRPSADFIPVLEGVEILEEKDKRTRLIAFVRQGAVERKYLFELMNENQIWKIQSFGLQGIQEAAPEGPFPEPGRKNNAAPRDAKAGESVSRAGAAKPGVSRVKGRQDSGQLRSELREVIEDARKKGKITEEEYQKKLELLQSMKLS